MSEARRPCQGARRCPGMPRSPPSPGFSGAPPSVPGSACQPGVTTTSGVAAGWPAGKDTCVSECGARSPALLSCLCAQSPWPRGAMMPIFRDLCLQSARMYLEFHEHLLRIQKHASMPGEYEGWGCLYSIRNIDCFITKKKSKPSHYNYHGAHICF